MQNVTRTGDVLQRGIPLDNKVSRMRKQILEEAFLFGRHFVHNFFCFLAFAVKKFIINLCLGGVRVDSFRSHGLTDV
ncbi:hypothetical protein Cenrod_1562 [Candidatus Symbiobacter mobilis CR]|uniref:Uncharacterized protein n=1 Tax=Candidatus Symbiobacter mobilis CR TaxID=946483 RepID=U5N8C0_9BURK|nr:hypothetical protein Cenrod_1562 [Candidatus Symbiobacter mobilis CR]